MLLACTADTLDRGRSIFSSTPCILRMSIHLCLHLWPSQMVQAMDLVAIRAGRMKGRRHAPAAAACILCGLDHLGDGVFRAPKRKEAARAVLVQGAASA